MSFSVESMTADHWVEVAVIYREGIATGHATFAGAPPERFEEWTEGKIAGCSVVACERATGVVLGWAALSSVSDRCVYAGVAEVSVYVSARARGQGVGAGLLGELIVRSEAAGIWTLQAGIFPENTASRALHERFDFREVGVRERLGRMTHGPRAGEWRDVLLLERRSATVGI